MRLLNLFMIPEVFWFSEDIEVLTIMIIGLIVICEGINQGIGAW